MQIFTYILHVRHVFWPSLHNSFHPYAIRMPTLALIAATLLLLQAMVHVDTQRGDVLGMADDITPERVLEATNYERRQAGINTLESDEALERAAQNKAQHMLEYDYWDHYAPDGTTPWDFIGDEGYTYQYAGENLAKNFQTSNGTVEGWMNSDEHRDNLLRNEYTDAGIGVASGRLHGRQTTLIVAMYATPRQLAVTSGPLPDEDAPMILPVANTYSVAEPLNITRTMPLPAQAAAMVAFILGIIYLGQHVIIRRKHLFWDTHVHPRPALQAVAMFSLVVVLIQLSFGAVS